jgi:hypothetical protein
MEKLARTIRFSRGLTPQKKSLDKKSLVEGDIVRLIEPVLCQGALLQATADLENAKTNLVAARAS